MSAKIKRKWYEQKNWFIILTCLTKIKRNHIQKQNLFFSVIVVAVLYNRKSKFPNHTIIRNVILLLENDKAIHAEYAIFTIDKREFINRLYSNGSCRF